MSDPHRAQRPSDRQVDPPASPGSSLRARRGGSGTAAAIGAIAVGAAGWYLLKDVSPVLAVMSGLAGVLVGGWLGVSFCWLMRTLDWFNA